MPCIRARYRIANAQDDGRMLPEQCDVGGLAQLHQRGDDILVAPPYA